MVFLKEFLWDGKDILEFPSSLSCLKMPSMITFDKALKLSWLKRIQSQYSGWTTFPKHYQLGLIPINGDRYAEKI